MPPGEPPSTEGAGDPASQLQYVYRPASSLDAPLPAHIWLARSTVLASLCLALLYKQPVAAAVTWFYRDYLLQQWWFCHDSFEPVLSTLCLLVFITGWFVWDTLVVAIQRYGWRDGFKAAYIRKHTLRDTSQHHGITTDELHHFLLPIAYYLLPILAFDYYHPRRSHKLAEHTLQPTLGRIVTDVTMSLLLYDALYFVWHVSLHHSTTLYRTVHAVHHAYSGPLLEARETVRLSLLEQIVDVGISIVALNLIHSHPLSRAVHNIVITWLLSELHCGYNYAWMLHNVLPQGVGTGPPVHALHHAGHPFTYAKFFAHCDSLYRWYCGAPLTKQSASRDRNHCKLV